MKLSQTILSLFKDENEDGSIQTPKYRKDLIIHLFDFCEFNVAQQHISCSLGQGQQKAGCVVEFFENTSVGVPFVLHIKWGVGQWHKMGSSFL